jgi:hypothetical protein
VDAATGDLTLKKGPVQLRISSKTGESDADFKPTKVLPPSPQNTVYDIGMGDVVQEISGGRYGVTGVVQNLNLRNQTALVGEFTSESGFGNKEIPLTDLKVMDKSPEEPGEDQKLDRLRDMKYNDVSTKEGNADENDFQFKDLFSKPSEETNTNPEDCVACGGRKISYRDYLTNDLNPSPCRFCDGAGLESAWEDKKLNIYGSLYDDIPQEKLAEATDNSTSTWEEFNRGKPVEYQEETTYSKDTHDQLGNNPKNRRTPNRSDVKITVPEWMNTLGVAYMLETQMAVPVSTSENTITVKDVEDPLGLITEMNEFGCDASLSGGSLPSLYEGQKIAFRGDLPKYNHLYDSTMPPITARIVRENQKTYTLRNDIWGSFDVRKEFVSEI